MSDLSPHVFWTIIAVMTLLVLGYLWITRGGDQD